MEPAIVTRSIEVRFGEPPKPTPEPRVLPSNCNLPENSARPAVAPYHRNLHARFFAGVIRQACLSRLPMSYVIGEIQSLNS